mmetsp:Transcript_28905/g.39887  ORF Transcript_28905/g.39887 Transcript_28905/m.39887 type:complete len:182 (-) Transcript_28905:285-830(-)
MFIAIPARLILLKLNHQDVIISLVEMKGALFAAAAAASASSNGDVHRGGSSGVTTTMSDSTNTNIVPNYYRHYLKQQQQQHQALQQQQHQAALHQHQQLPPPGPRGMERDVIMEGPHSIVRQPPNIDMKMKQQLSLHEGIRRPPPMQNGGMGGADRLRGRMGAQAGAYGGPDTKPMFMGGQ